MTTFRSIATILLALTLIIAVTLSLYWYRENQYSDQRDWDANRQNLPDIEVLQQRIQNSLFSDNSASLDAVGTDTDQIMDPQAMEAKLAGLTKNVTTLRQPSEQELFDYYREHQAEYREFSLFSFRHLFFSSAKYGGSAYQQAEQYLQQLNNGIEPTNVAVFQAASDQIEATFGRSFADKLLIIATQPPSQSRSQSCWTGPIASRLGVHIVCIDNAVVGEIPSLDEVRSQVINDWRFANAGEG
ncbi:MAG: peptidyl-prolyl cis-trans isomerase [Porticoccaceae bacterium]